MKTEFKNVTDLKTNIQVGQKVFIENFGRPELSRNTVVKNKYSNFFTVDKDGAESWIVNGSDQNKRYNFIFEKNTCKMFWKHDNTPYLTIHF